MINEYELLSKKTIVTWIFCIQKCGCQAEIVWQSCFNDIIQELIDTETEKKIRGDSDILSPFWVGLKMGTYFFITEFGKISI